MRRSQRVAFEGGNGSQLSGILDLPAEHSKATVLFTHCFTCNKDLKAIVRISRGLAAAGFTVLRYDLTGLGGSHGDFSHTNFSTNLADLQAAVGFLDSSVSPPKFLIGHSFGAACSLAQTEAIDSVVGVVSIAGPSDTRHLADFLERMNADISLKGIGSVNIGGRDYAIRQQMLDDFRGHDLPATIRRISKPALLFHSPDDRTLGFEHVLRLYSFLTQRSPQDREPSPASLICLPGADHLLASHPADIEFVTAACAAWFDRILAGVQRVEKHCL